MATTKQMIKTFEMFAGSNLSINYNNGDCVTTWRVASLGSNTFKFILQDSPKTVFTIVWEDEIAGCKNLDDVLQFAYKNMRAY